MAASTSLPAERAADRVTEAGVAFERKRHELTSAISKKIDHLTGADRPHRDGPGTATRVFEGVERYGERNRTAIEDAGRAEARCGVARRRDEDRALAHRGVDPALAFAEKHIGTLLDRLADPSATERSKCARESCGRSQRRSSRKNCSRTHSRST